MDRFFPCAVRRLVVRIYYHIGGDLDLRGTNITALPDGLSVGGQIVGRPKAPRAHRGRAKRPYRRIQCRLLVRTVIARTLPHVADCPFGTCALRRANMSPNSPPCHGALYGLAGKVN